jgi:hypothetical protein
MDKDKRENGIYELREQGLTYSHIASIFDISRSRAHQIFRIAKYKRDTIETLPPLKRKLSKRTQKDLVKHFGSESILEEPQKIALLGSLQILRINNVGRKSLREISSNTECLSELKRIRVYESYRTSIILEDLKLSRKNFRRQRRHLKTP